MQPVPSLQDDIFGVKTRKNGVKVEKVKSIIFSKFFFEINVKFDADFNGTDLESRRRHLRAQNSKKTPERVKNLEIFFFLIFFFKSM